MGRAIILGDSVNTDQIISGEFVRRDDYTKFLFQKFRDDINRLVLTGEVAGRILVAGRNFGSGSSRERAAIGLKEVGTESVVAYSYNPIWERNAINCGLRIYRFDPSVKHDISEGDELEFDSNARILANKTTGRIYPLMETPPFVEDIWNAGGLVNSVRQQYLRGRQERPTQ